MKKEVIKILNELSYIGELLGKFILNIKGVNDIINFLLLLIQFILLIMLVSIPVILGIFMIHCIIKVFKEGKEQKSQYYLMRLEILTLLEEKKFINNYNEIEKINCVREKVQLDKYKRRHREDTSPILDEKYSNLKIQNNNDKHSNIST